MSRYPWVSLGEHVTLSVDEVMVQPSETYQPVGIYSFGKGLFARHPISGIETKYQKFHRLHEGQLVLSRLNGWEGAVAVVPASFDGCVVSQEYPTFDLTGDLRPDYLGWICRWSSFWDQLVPRGSMVRRKRSHPARLLEARIPLPEPPEQDRIGAWLERISIAGNQVLGLSRGNLGGSEAAWWAILRHEFEALGQKFPMRRIDELADVNPESVAPQIEFADRTFKYVDISSVANGTGKIVDPKEYAGPDAPSRARRRIRAGDVLISTVRPNLRGFAEVPIELDGQVCSTGFAVLRPKEGVSSLYLLYQVMSDLFLDQLVASMRGGHYPAVNDSVLRETQLIRPSPEVQRATVARLAEIEPKISQASDLCRDRVSRLEALIPALLNATLNGR